MGKKETINKLMDLIRDTKEELQIIADELSANIHEVEDEKKDIKSPTINDYAVGDEVEFDDLFEYAGDRFVITYIDYEKETFDGIKENGRCISHVPWYEYKKTGRSIPNVCIYFDSAFDVLYKKKDEEDEEEYKPRHEKVKDQEFSLTYEGITNVHPADFQEMLDEITDIIDSYAGTDWTMVGGVHGKRD